MPRLFITFFLLVFSLDAVRVVADEPANRRVTYPKQIVPVLRKYCFDCHGPDTAEAKLRMDRLDPDLMNGPDADRWHEVLNRINAGEMPPEEADQPKREERERLTGWLTKALQEAAAAKRGTGGGVVFRRLNRREYNNTLNDLFGIDLDISHLLPPEGPSEDGFTNNGRVLVMSPLHFEYYLKIARIYLRKAIAIGPRPEQFGFHFEFQRKSDGKMDLSRSQLDGSDRAIRASLNIRQGRSKAKKSDEQIGDWVTLSPGVRAVGTGIPARQGPAPLLQIRLFEFPSEGAVRIRVKAAALESKDGRFPHLGVVIGNHLDDGIEIEQIGDLVEVKAVPGKPQVYEFIGRLENLPLPFRNKDLGNRGDLNQAMIGIWNAYEPDSDDRKSPRLAVYSVDFEAPYTEQWPPKSHSNIFFPSENSNGEESYAREIFSRFLRRAYRRPASESELDRLMALWRDSREKPKPVVRTEPVVEPTPGIRVDYFEPHPADVSLRTLEKRKPTTSGVVPAISFDVPQRKRDDAFALRFSGNLKVETPGLYTLFVASDDGSRIYLDGKELINNDGLHGMKERQASAKLSSGWHSLVVTYFDNGGGDGLEVNWAGPNFEKQPIPASALAVKPGTSDTVVPAQTFEESIRDVLPAALISPAFLYLVEPSADDEPRKLTDHELAARLSYFLWSTIPDETLNKLADTNELHKPEKLRQQVRRMLADPRSQEFVSHFVDQWLELESLDRVAINRDVFRSFMPYMKEAMRNETRAFFAEILHQDLNAMNLVDADFAVVNPLLARHYGIKGVQGAEFRRVDLTNESRRGGLLTQGAILTGNANGEDSHPIKRGVWLLKKILDDPPPPPPPNVPDLDREDPKLSGLPLKEQLELHRNHQACNSCHRKIDPWGIPFEEFSAIGQFRTQVGRKKRPVIAETTLPDGTQISGTAELGRYLVTRKSEQIGRCITVKLLTYALGRSLTFADEDIIENLDKKFRQSDFKLRVLIEEIVTSPLFIVK